MANLYNLVVKPAVLGLSPTAKASWPRFYSVEMFRILLSSGQHTFESVLIAEDDVHDFAMEVIRLLRRQAWGWKAFYVTEVHGHKDASWHDPQTSGEDEQFRRHSEVNLRKMADGLDVDVLL